MKHLAILAAALLLVCTFDQDYGDLRRKAAKNSAKILADLYTTLTNVAFPKPPSAASDVTSYHFVLLSPGKVLNYWNCYPGAEYKESLVSRNNSATEALVPPASRHGEVV